MLPDDYAQQIVRGELVVQVLPETSQPRDTTQTPLPNTQPRVSQGKSEPKQDTGGTSADLKQILKPLSLRRC